MSTTIQTGDLCAAPDTRWRTRDIVVAAVIGVAFGVAFCVGRRHLVGPRVPGAGSRTCLRRLAAAGHRRAAHHPQARRGAVRRDRRGQPVGAARQPWGVDTLLSGFVQGAAAELVFAFTLLPALDGFPVLAAAGLAASAAAAFVHDVVLLVRRLCDGRADHASRMSMAVSGGDPAAAGGLGLVGALRRTGVLDGFPA